LKTVAILSAFVAAAHAAHVSPLDNLGADKTCTKQTGQCPVARCVGGPPAGCSYSTLLIERTSWFGGEPACCPELCVFRKDGPAGKGTGDVCKIERTTRFPPMTTPAPLAPCPLPCKDLFQTCVARYQDDEICLKYAEAGYLCKDHAKCDAIAFVKGKEECVGGKQFTECGSACELTCDNADNGPGMCIEMCVQGCFCIGEANVWDAASEQCMTLDTCPGVNQCESTIGENFLNTGNLVTQCSSTNEDDTCYATDCVSGMCVPDGNWDAGSKMDIICGKNKNEKGCLNGKEQCRWAEGSEGGVPPVFICTEGEWVYGKGGCTFVEPAGVTTIPPDVEAACAHIEESGCYQSNYEPACDLHGADSGCFGIVRTAYSKCGADCLSFTAASTNPKCGECVENALFNTATIDPMVPDIYTCCNCLDAAFSAVGVPSAEVDRMLQLTCPITNDDMDDVFYNYDDDFRV